MSPDAVAHRTAPSASLNTSTETPPSPASAIWTRPVNPPRALVETRALTADFAGVAAAATMVRVAPLHGRAVRHTSVATGTLLSFLFNPANLLGVLEMNVNDMGRAAHLQAQPLGNED